MSPDPTPPIVLAIGGSDGSGGAGVAADAKTISALGGYALTAQTAVVAQAPGEVRSVAPLSPELVAVQLQVLSGHFPFQAIKLGMLADKSISEVVIGWLAEQCTSLPMVIDPVLRATAGAVLLEEAAMPPLLESLYPRCSLLTPNLIEAKALAQYLHLDAEQDSRGLAEELHAAIGCPILLKGGHDDEPDTVTDILVYEAELTRFSAKRLRVPDLHGTGCALASAIATFLSQGKTLPESVDLARDYLRGAMANHLTFAGPRGAKEVLWHSAN